MEWMSPMDASFLHIEGPNNPMHIGGVSIFEGPPPAYERLEEMVAALLGAESADVRTSVTSSKITSYTRQPAKVRAIARSASGRRPGNAIRTASRSRFL